MLKTVIVFLNIFLDFNTLFLKYGSKYFKSVPVTKKNNLK